MLEDAQVEAASYEGMLSTLNQDAFAGDKA